MIPVFTCLEMNALDACSSQGKPELGFEFMRRAARSAFDLIIQRYLEIQKRGEFSSITIFAGTGNNGGDGILLTAYLLEEGYPTKCFIIGSEAKLKNEALLAYHELKENDPKQEHHQFIEEIDDFHSIEEYFSLISPMNEHHLFIDALIGIGLKSAPDELMTTVIDFLNQNSHLATIFSIDCPSGVDNDTGYIRSVAVRADNTITMGFPKLGSFFYPGRMNFGFTIVNSLGYNEDLVRESSFNKLFFVNSFENLIPPRVINGSKYNHGLGVLFAGSSGMCGAAALSAKAAYRVGLGILHFFSSPDVNRFVNNQVLEAITHEDFADFDQLNPAALAIGPGWTNSEFVLDLISNVKTPAILDAGAITALKGNLKLLSKHKGEILMTPHAGEYEKIFGKNEHKTILDLIMDLKAKANKYKISILYKGNPTIIVDKSSQVFILPYGNSSLAKAGSGDALTGMILGFAAQIAIINKNNPQYRFLFQNLQISMLTQAAILGAYVHAKAAEVACEVLGEYSLTANELIDFVGDVMSELDDVHNRIFC